MRKKFLNFVIFRYVAAAFLVFGFVLPGLSGCSSAGEYLTNVGKAALGMDIESDKKEEKKPADKNVVLTFMSGKNLNESDHVPMSAAGRVFYLKSLDSWVKLNMKQLMSEKAEDLLGSSLIEFHDIVLTPDARFVEKKIPPEDAAYVGVAVFFYSAAQQRWRYAFEIKPEGTTTIVMGVHACALSVSQGEPVTLPNAPKHDPASLAFVKCEPPPG